MERRDAPRVVRSFGVVPFVLVVAQVQSVSDAASRRLSWVIVGLLLLAAMMLVATVIFWRATRPDPVQDPPIAMRWNLEDRPSVAPDPRAPAPGAGPRGRPPLPALVPRNDGHPGRAASFGATAGPDSPTR